MNKDIEIATLSKRLIRYKVAVGVLVVALPIVAYFVPQYFKPNPSTDSKYPLLDPLREYVSPDSYITNIQDFRVYLAKLNKQYPNTFTVYYENLNSGANISVNKDMHLYPASLTKVVQAILIAEKVEQGSLQWNTKLKALPEDLSSDSGTLYERIGDSSMTVEDLMKEMLVNSDNTAQNIFKRNLDIPDYVAFQDDTGLDDLYNDQGLISAKEYTRILRVLYTSNFLEPENSEKILKYMSDSVFKDYLSQGIPSGIQFAHKFGENKDQNIFADSGIVYIPGKPYMITVLIKGKDATPETRAWAVGLMKDISIHAYSVSN
jgi:beta-lactamase class A